jgi:hypothetical protein
LRFEGQEAHGTLKYNMSRYQNGQPQYNPYPPQQPPPLPLTPHNGSHPLPPQPPIRRAPSFDAGDDEPFYRGGENEYHEYDEHRNPAQGTRGSFGTGNSITPAGRGYSTANAPGTMYPASPDLHSTSQSPYNPSQYANPYASPSYAAPAQRPPANASRSPNIGHQPYIPAAYSATTTPNPNVYAPYDSPPPTWATSPGYAPPGPPGQPPPVPPRPFGYTGSVNITSNSYSAQPPNPAYRQAPIPSYVPMPMPPSPGYPRHDYTPPVPPPPPRSPNPEPYNAPPVPQPITARPRGHSGSMSQSAITLPSSSRSSSYHHRLPSLPNYHEGTGDYATPISEYAPSPRPPSGRSVASSPGSRLSQHSPQPSNTGARHPQSRPLPGPPTTSDYFTDKNGETNDENLDSFSYDEIFKEIEEAVSGRTPSVNHHSRASRGDSVSHPGPISEEEEEPKPSFAHEQNDLGITPDEIHTHTVVSATHSRMTTNYENYVDDSDQEAAAGLVAMAMADKEDAAMAARNMPGRMSTDDDYTSQHSPNISRHSPGAHNGGFSSDSDIPIDMATYGGNIPSVHYSYGDTPGSARGLPYPQEAIPYELDSRRVSGEPTAMMPSAEDFIYAGDAIHPFPMFNARTDTGGTGGLSEPNVAHSRRLSFEDGDEATLVDSEGGHYLRDDASVHSSYLSRGPSRPLPNLPGLETDIFPRRQVDEFGKPIYPQAPEEYDQSYTPAGGPLKSNSIGSYTSTPPVAQPLRSITDASDPHRRRPAVGGLRTNLPHDHGLGPETSTPPGKLTDLDLPTIPAGKRRRFVPGKLSTQDFRLCSEPWALSSVLQWVKDMTEGEADLKEQAIIDGMIALFTHKVPTMNTADAEVLSAKVLASMLEAGALTKEEEWVKVTSVPMAGVLFQLTGTGCYSPRVHNFTIQGRCYSHHCMRTLKKINLQTHILAPKRKVEDWATFYNVTKDLIDEKPKKDVERQNNLHEIVTSEDYFMDQLDVLRVLYRDGLAYSQQPIIAPNKVQSFLLQVFGKVDPIKVANEEHLLAQLKYRQQEQGPWITGFSDIFREWVRKAKQPYVEYAAALPNALLLVKREAERNVLFRQFLDQMRENERSRRLGWDTYLKAPITRLQRYTLLLSTLYKNMPEASEEKVNLGKAIDEIKVVTLECDTRVAEMSKRVDLYDLSVKLRLRPGMEKVQLNLDHLGREILMQGSLQRKGTNKVSWLETYAILFDHYLVMAKPLQQRDAAGGLKQEKYDVSKLVSHHPT